MKILTIIGTRPEIIRLSVIMKKIDQFADKHIIVHTGQNFTYSLNDVFFEELNLRKPDYILDNRENSFGNQLSLMFRELEKILESEKPDKVLLLGDTNSALSAVLAERMNIPVYHMEAGNRCYDLRVPEEKNRRVIDAVSTINLPYTKRSRENLLKEGLSAQRIFTCGNPISEVLDKYKLNIKTSNILNKLQLKSGDYFLVTIHRAENVDVEHNLTEIFKGLNRIAEVFNQKMICSIHPRTRSKLDRLSTFTLNPLIEYYEPFGFFDFVKLEKNARCVLTDSGTVQEECCLFGVPTVTVRNSTERPETVECGSNIVSGLDSKNIENALRIMVSKEKTWEIPEGYLDPLVSDKIIAYLFGGIASAK
ncbi:UDP-N-acetylglucosamine 2-epimerase (non-hydrolysing) [Scopulibacillus darangshiensis]|uniref:UDP-N-acetylglucosamine 2-epimerase (Non-hydrolysing) n=1 Tax=Scopulibacillus darangshiensis TaxID=442528 RepID=A0A4R2NPP6_9BACL|nr:UDP-N-acetylglucosamine 2-epimerase (non-hydrolyzing) [Scopulibacillus darangshiensis]TCP23799.1 UDP-N-acetylglucosamine 2-epimerase (non-hydrolysing) [Scopulibacillus darangshiensis]